MHYVKNYCVYEITPFVAQELNVHNLLNFTNQIFKHFIYEVTFYDNILVLTCKYIKGIAATQFIVMSNV